jgi:peptide/histidine transporter 3/4
MGLSIATGGWAANLIVFLITEFNVKSIAATKIYNVVLACSSLFPVAGAILADSFFGSFPVVATFAFVSLLVIKYVAFYILLLFILKIN